MKSYGDLNETLKFGILKINSPEYDGFGALGKAVLGGLVIMDEKGLLPYIDIKSDCYTEKHKVHGSFNAFEYYFIQPCDVITGRHIPREEILQSAHVEFIPEEDARSVMDGCRFTGAKGNYSVFYEQEIMDQVAMALRKYIRLNKFSAQIYDQMREKIGDGNIIGIQIRRTGFKQHTPGHPIAVDPIEHLNLFKEIKNGRRAFLATDEEMIIKMFAESEEGKDVVWYEDVLRTPENLADENIAVYCCEVNRVDHKYRLGYEVLKDILTLSYCESLIAGYSCVSLLATIVKMSRQEKYKEYHIIDKGIWPLEDGSGWEHHWEYYRHKIRKINRDNTGSESRE